MACIYKLTNLINGKIYIGQAINFKERMARHARSKQRCEQRPTNTTPVSRAIAKYGFNNFKKEIVEDGIPNDIEHMDNAERFWIAKLDATNPMIGYNSSTGGHFGYHVNEITKQKKRDFRHTEEEKIRRSKAVCVYRELNSRRRIKFFPNAKSVADVLGNTRSEVSKAIKRGSLIRGLYIFYRDDDRRKECYDAIVERKSKMISGNGLGKKSLDAYCKAYSNVNEIVTRINNLEDYQDSYTYKDD